MAEEKICLDYHIFKFVYIEAMGDAVNQRAYEGKKKWLEGEDVMKSLKEGIEHLINKVINGEYSSQEEYDKDFLALTIDVCSCINNKAKNNKFTFGNAQKLINIMLKYFYITSYKNDSEKEKFRFCHCPMDQQLLKKVWDIWVEFDKVTTRGQKGYFLKSWGNEDFEEDESGNKTFPKRYDLFQKKVRYFSKLKNMNPLEYDYYEYQ